jgi:hypothetical protein
MIKRRQGVLLIKQVRRALGEPVVAASDFEHPAPGFRITHLFSMYTRLFGALAPVLGIVPQPPLISPCSRRRDRESEGRPQDRWESGT